jgi:proline iminopeptidase
MLKRYWASSWTRRYWQRSKLEAKGEFENPRYMELLMPNFITNTSAVYPWKNGPTNVEAFSKINHTIYVMMQGPSEFGLSGKLETGYWQPTGRHHGSDSGHRREPRHDAPGASEMDVGTSSEWRRYLLCENGSHMCMWTISSVT